MPEELYSYPNQETWMTNLVRLAMQQTEDQLRNGQCPPSVVNSLLRLGTVQAELELERTRAQTQLAIAKADQIHSQENYERMLQDCLGGMRRYGNYLFGEGGAFDDNSYSAEYTGPDPTSVCGVDGYPNL